MKGLCWHHIVLWTGDVLPHIYIYKCFFFFPQTRINNIRNYSKYVLNVLKPDGVYIQFQKNLLFMYHTVTAAMECTTIYHYFPQLHVIWQINSNLLCWKQTRSCLEIVVSGERWRNRVRLLWCNTQILGENQWRDTFAEYQSFSESLCFSSSNRFLRWLEQQPFCRECKPVKEKERKTEARI